MGGLVSFLKVPAERVRPHFWTFSVGLTAHIVFNIFNNITGNALTRTHFNLSLRGAQRRGNLDEVEHTSANRRWYDNEIATLRSQ